MLKALKENKEYTITEEQKSFYRDGGFDIYKDGELIEYSPLKKIEFAKYVAVKNELDEAKESFLEFNASYEVLRKELTDLKAENDKLRKDLEKLKKAGA